MTTARTPSTQPRPIRSLRALEELRRRVRMVFFFDGVIAFALALCAVAATTFVLDYGLSLPRGVRVVVLAVAGVYLASVVVRRMLRPKQIPVPLEDLAVLVESTHPELRQALVTAVQLTDPRRRSATWLSSELIADVVAQAERALPALSLNRVFRLRRFAGTLGLLCLILAAFASGVSARGDLAAIWSRRIFLLSNERWPKRVRLALVSPAESPVTIALGEDVPVEVAVERGDPSEVEVRSWTSESGLSRDSRVDLMRKTPEGSFKRVFERVSRPFSFRVRGGDDELEQVDVLVEIRPKVGLVKLWCAYPAHTGRESTPADAPIRHGHLNVPEGTVVRYEAYSDVPVAAAWFHFLSTDAAREAVARRTSTGDDAISSQPDDGAAGGWPPVPPEQLTALPIDVVQGEADEDGGGDDRPRSRFQGAFTVTEEGFYMFYLRGENGLTNNVPVRFRVKAIKDRAPSVRIREPFKVNEEVSPDAIVTMKIVARDDYGIERGAIRGVLFAGEEETPLEFPLAEFASTGPADARTDAEATLQLEVASIGGVTGARFEYFAAASDYGGNTGESEQFVLHVVDKADILRVLQSELMVVKDQIEAVERQQESARKDLESFHDQVRERERLGAEDAGKLARHRQNQQRVTRGIARAANEIDRILGRMESNRVGEERDKSWMGEMRDELTAIADERSRGLERELQALRDESADSASEGSPSPKRIDPVVDGQRTVERELRSIALRLSEYGDINSIIQQWREILRRQLEIQEQVAEELRRRGGAQ